MTGTRLPLIETVSALPISIHGRKLFGKGLISASTFSPPFTYQQRVGWEGREWGGLAMG